MWLSGMITVLYIYTTWFMFSRYNVYSCFSDVFVVHPSGPQPMGTSKSIPCLGPTWRGSSPYLQVNMKKLSFQHTCEQGAVLIGPHLQTWQRFLRWLGTWEHGMDLFAIRNGLILISKSDSMDPKNAPQPFQAPVQNERLPPFSSVVLLLVSEIPQRDSLTSSLKQRPVFFDSREVPMLENDGKCAKLLTSLDPLAFSASGLLQMSFFENIEI